jgi:hypothetical protein
MMNNSFVCLQPSGHYGEALRYKGLLKIGQSFVIDYKSFIKFANTGQITEPVFVSENYSEAIAEAQRLNDLRQETK